MPSSSHIVVLDPTSDPTPMSSLPSLTDEHDDSISKDKNIAVEQSHDDTTTCIVCLVDLPETSSDNSVGDSFNQIARLVPCNHAMHNRCLAPWVQRANSCPICRQSFNRVQLHCSLSGPMTSEYTVEDRIQKPDTDLNFLDEDLDAYEYERCLLCDESRDSNQFIVCDCCKGSFHTFCCDLHGLPEGDWFCPLCVSMGYDLSQFAGSSQGNLRLQRRPVEHQRRNTRNWAGVWQDVWSYLNRDLDDDHDSEDAEDVRAAQLRDWDRRAQIAQAQGGGASAFRDMAPCVIGSTSRPWEKISTDAPGSEEAEEAWNALAQFRAIESGAQSVERKRRASDTQIAFTSHEDQSERKLKRPRTKPNSALTSSVKPSSSLLPATRSGPQPSVFGSWLSKLGSQGDSESVQASLNTCSISTFNMASTSPARTGPQSPSFASSSPPLSPTSLPWSRPQSPLTLTDRSAFSPSPSRSPDPLFLTCEVSRFRPTSPDYTPSSYPTRFELTMSMKEEIQCIVRSVLRPFYQASIIDTDQYTEINKGVSRHLYELVGSSNAGISPAFTENQEERQRLRSIAEAEVEVAVGRFPPK